MSELKKFVQQYSYINNITAKVADYCRHVYF